MSSKNVLIVLTILSLLFATIAAVFFARGYNFDFKTAKISPTGILVATSDPDGAEVLINGKLNTATNNTINLPPGKYSVKIAKEGFTPWEKTITIKAEEVFKTNVYLFPALPELRPITLSGAQNPALSPDKTRIAFIVASASAEKNGVWILDMGRLPVPGLFSSDLRQITKIPLSQLFWSSDNKQILADNAFLLETDRLNSFLLDVSGQLPALFSQWQDWDKTRYLAQTGKLHPNLSATLATASSKLEFSPDENKILYVATASATLPTVLATYLPGTNPTPETRQISAGNTYVYDIKEDRNYLIENCSPVENCRWFPTSRHLLSHNEKEIAVREFDGTNKATVYAGPFINGFVFPWPTGTKIIILTSLNTASGPAENLYSINLR